MTDGYLGEKISHQFKKLAMQLGLPEKPAKNKAPEQYSYLQSHDPKVITAHGHSLMARSFQEDPVFHSERHRRAAEILYDKHRKDDNDIGCNHLISALLLQDIVHFKAADGNTDKVMPYDALNTLFDMNVMSWVNDYIETMDGTDYVTKLYKAKPGIKCMTLATMIEYLEHSLEQTRHETGAFYKRIMSETNDVPALREEQITTQRGLYFKVLGQKEGILDQRQAEFSAVKGVDEEMDRMFQSKMDAYRNHIRAWKTDNGYEQRKPPQTQPGSSRQP